jgi:tripartite-type tricarboxylate transporter receptor subunit TctC
MRALLPSVPPAVIHAKGNHLSLTIQSALVVLAAIFAAAPAHAAADAAFPVRPIRLVIPFPPGGTPDIQARMLAEKLAPRLGQPVVIDNRGGANGIIGMGIVAQAPADGHTLVVATVGTWAVHPHLYKLPYDIERDFAPVINLAGTPAVLVVHPSLPVKSVKELVALARQKSGELSYGSVGVGGFFHISAELFAHMAGISMLHVPYKGGAVALSNLVGGHIQLMFNSTIVSLPHIQAGRVRALATTAATRSLVLPDLPTIAEAGVPGYEGITWTAVGAPARTPRAAIERLNREFNAALQSPDIRERLASGGSVVIGGTPEQFRDYLKAELAKYGKLVKAAGIKGDSAR